MTTATAERPEAQTSIAAQELRLFVERAERLREEKKGIEDDLKEVFGEMRGRGYDVARVKDLMKIRAMKKGEFEEQSMVLETYMAAMGMI